MNSLVKENIDLIVVNPLNIEYLKVDVVDTVVMVEDSLGRYPGKVDPIVVRYTDTGFLYVADASYRNIRVVTESFTLVDNDSYTLSYDVIGSIMSIMKGTISYTGYDNVSKIITSLTPGEYVVKYITGELDVDVIDTTSTLDYIDNDVSDESYNIVVDDDTVVQDNYPVTQPDSGGYVDGNSVFVPETTPVVLPEPVVVNTYDSRLQDLEKVAHDANGELVTLDRVRIVNNVVSVPNIIGSIAFNLVYIYIDKDTDKFDTVTVTLDKETELVVFDTEDYVNNQYATLSYFKKKY